MPRHPGNRNPPPIQVPAPAQFVPLLEAKVDAVNQTFLELVLIDVFAAVENQPPVTLNVVATSPTSPAPIHPPPSYDEDDDGNDIKLRKIRPNPEGKGHGACPDDESSSAKPVKNIETTIVLVKSSSSVNPMQNIFATILGYYMDDVPTEADFLTADTGVLRKEVKKSTKKTLFGARKKLAKKFKKDCKHEWREVCTLCESVKRPHPQKACKKIKVCGVCKEGAVVIHSPRKPFPSSNPTIVRNITTNNNITNNIFNYYMVPSQKDLQALQHQMVKPSTPSNPVGLNFKLIHSQENSQQGLILHKQKMGGRIREKWQSYKKKITAGIKGVRLLEL